MAARALKAPLRTRLCGAGGDGERPERHPDHGPAPSTGCHPRPPPCSLAGCPLSLFDGKHRPRDLRRSLRAPVGCPESLIAARSSRGSVEGADLLSWALTRRLGAVPRLAPVTRLGTPSSARRSCPGHITHGHRLSHSVRPSRRGRRRHPVVNAASRARRRGPLAPRPGLLAHARDGLASCASTTRSDSGLASHLAIYRTILSGSARRGQRDPVHTSLPAWTATATGGISARSHGLRSRHGRGSSTGVPRQLRRASIPYGRPCYPRRSPPALRAQGSAPVTPGRALG